MQEKKRKGYATQAQQREADRRYYHASEENRQRKLYISGRSQAKSFIKNRATLEDLDMLNDLISEERKKF
ncbi:TPA: hypothetical protein U1Z40_001116 [Streptococcus suis]|uniref:hypothetical protein n=1 Tax=Streptococcus suis TaxID=1307 RepID=UPI0015581F97|nr:hypothetical protein [Streptococcus suis]HEL2298841.1 hypothetical protein [Streptococcus suis]HEM4567877.1 hypothetical protein [Streptococcus suis]HEM5552193.1 hypothetical protein [Streptococcus suis]HEP1824813.1 hypothetical protein [Streptococcus suis]